MISGVTENSRLIELRKYKITNIFTEKYIGNGNYDNNGVDFNSSNENTNIVYYINGIKYVDNVTGKTTIFYYNPESTINFISEIYYKNPSFENLIFEPKINNDVFIERQKTSAFDDNYKLKYICNLGDLYSYAGGKYFNIIKNI